MGKKVLSLSIAHLQINNAYFNFLILRLLLLIVIYCVCFVCLFVCLFIACRCFSKVLEKKRRSGGGRELYIHILSLYESWRSLEIIQRTTSRIRRTETASRGHKDKSTLLSKGWIQSS